MDVRCLLRSLAGCLLALAASAQTRNLTILQPALHQFDGGPPLPGAHEFHAGEYVWVSFLVDGYKVVEKDVIRLSYEIEAVDADGVKYVETKKDTIQATLAVQDKEWKPKVHYDFLLPPLALANTGHIEIRVRDEIAGATAERRIPLQVRGPNIRPTETLDVQRFRFFRTERDTVHLQVAAYRPGDTVWARFDITGYKMAGNNRFRVWYGLEVLRESGSSLYKEPKAAEQQEESFYPQRYMEGSLSLNLTKDLAPGEYTITVHVRDEVGEQDYETSQKFVVE